MKISFLGQGFNSRDGTLGAVLQDSLSDVAFNKFTCVVASTSLSGINGIGEAIKKSQHIKRCAVIVGIDLATPKDALEGLLRLDISAQVFYPNSNDMIFHPKVYIFEGPKKCRIIVGSSNLTAQGLYQNIEASIVVDFDLPDAQGEQFRKQVYDCLEPVIEGKSNLKTLTPDLIALLFELNKIPPESVRAKTLEGAPAPRSQEKIKKLEVLNSLFPAVKAHPVPQTFKVKTGGEKQVERYVKTAEPRFLDSEIVTDRLGRTMRVEACTAGEEYANGALVYHRSNNEIPNLGTALPIYLSPLSRMIFLGRIPGQIIEWPEQAFVRTWAPVWALAKDWYVDKYLNKREHWLVSYCGSNMSEETPKEIGFSKAKPVHLWKDVILNSETKLTRKMVEDVARLWEDYKEAARHV